MPEIDRAPFDRRSPKERRKRLSLARFKYKSERQESERRGPSDRRTTPERRNGWVRMSKWASVCLDKLKIAKFLK